MFLRANNRTDGRTDGPTDGQCHTIILKTGVYKVWDEITYPFPDFNGETVEVWEWINIFIPHFTCDYLSILGFKLKHVCKRGRRSQLVNNVPDTTCPSQPTPCPNYSLHRLINYLMAGCIFKHMLV